MHDQLIESFVEELREIGRTTCDGQLAGCVPRLKFSLSSRRFY